MNASELNKKGVELEKKGDYKAALEIITKAIQLDSSNAIYFTNRACVRWKINKCRPCLDDWNEAIRINPKYSRAYQQRALAYSFLGENEKAIADLTTAAELDPDNINIRFDRALEYQTIKKLEDSLADFTFVIESNAKQKKADNFRFFFERGFVYIWLDEFEKAKEDLEKSLLITEDATVVGWLSYAFFKLGNFEKALDLSEKALEKDKDLRVSMYIKASILQDKEKYEEAIEFYKKFLSYDNFTDFWWKELSQVVKQRLMLCIKSYFLIKEKSKEEEGKSDPVFQLLEEYETTKVKHNKAQEKIKIHTVDIADANQKAEDLKNELTDLKKKYEVLCGNTLEQMTRDDISEQIQVHKDIIKELKKKKRELKTQRDCVICLDKPKSMVLVPCGHKVYCDGCAVGIPNESKCPCCRSAIERIIKVFD